MPGARASPVTWPGAKDSPYDSGCHPLPSDGGGGLGRSAWGEGAQLQEGRPCNPCSPQDREPASAHRGPCPWGLASAPHLLQQRQLAEELVGAVLSQKVGPLLAGLGVGAIDVLKEAGLGQGRRDGVWALLVVGQRQPVASGRPPGEGLQGRRARPAEGPPRSGSGGEPGLAPGPGPLRLAQPGPRANPSCPRPRWLLDTCPGHSVSPPWTQLLKFGPVCMCHGETPSGPPRPRSPSDPDHGPKSGREVGWSEPLASPCCP